MRDEISSTAQYLSMINELRRDLAEANARTAKLLTTLEYLIERHGEPKYVPGVATNKNVATPENVRTLSVSAPTVDLTGLGVGEACMAVLRASSHPMRNRDVLEALAANGFKIESGNPLNNVTSALNHRLKKNGDVAKFGKKWMIKKSESPAFSEALHINGAVVPAA